MPQLSPMSWLFMSILLGGVLVLSCVELWWCHTNCYSGSSESSKVSKFEGRVCLWGWGNLM
uniref:ATP synthase F0 subunit 8 n=1 Tax=Physunio superbus TaxID=2494254 RepID=A0A8A3WIX3_9BIVA|nr:ATP synthase F0 subunit 8 [Physunio superbus]